MSAAPIEHLNARLARGDVVVIDGATGTELEARGVPMDDAAWCGVANLEYAEVARDIHADYIRAERTAAGRLECWQGHGLLFDDLVQGLAAPDLAALMVMHTDVADVDDALEAVFRHWDGPVGVYPHVGAFVPPSWQFDERLTPADLVVHSRRWVERGVRIVGGCCGLGPGYIEALAAEFGA